MFFVMMVIVRVAHCIMLVMVVRMIRTMPMCVIGFAAMDFRCTRLRR